MGVHFFTGFPGFISSQLIRELFQENKTQKVIAIVLAGQYPKAMIEKSKIEVDYPQCEIQIVEGDITLPNLGLANQLIQEIVPQIEVFWHLAAIYDLADRKSVV